MQKGQKAYDQYYMLGFSKLRANNKNYFKFGHLKISMI